MGTLLHRLHVKRVVCDEVVERVQTLFTRRMHKSIRRASQELQLCCSTVMTLFISACIYMHTKSSFVGTSSPTIVSGQNLRLRCSHALMRTICIWIPSTSLTKQPSTCAAESTSTTVTYQGMRTL